MRNPDEIRRQARELLTSELLAELGHKAKQRALAAFDTCPGDTATREVAYKDYRAYKILLADLRSLGGDPTLRALNLNE